MRISILASFFNETIFSFWLLPKLRDKNDDVSERNLAKIAGVVSSKEKCKQNACKNHHNAQV